MERLQDHDVADAIRYIVSRPRRVSINEILIRPTDQTN
jgi:NADP-dependent 3-hydroxy acid dehydrogenase YdfG